MNKYDTSKYSKYVEAKNAYDMLIMYFDRFMKDNNRKDDKAAAISFGLGLASLKLDNPFNEIIEQMKIQMEQEEQEKAKEDAEAAKADTAVETDIKTEVTNEVHTKKKFFGRK